LEINDLAGFIKTHQQEVANLHRLADRGCDQQL